MQKEVGPAGPMHNNRFEDHEEGMMLKFCQKISAEVVRGQTSVNYHKGKQSMTFQRDTINTI